MTSVSRFPFAIVLATGLAAMPVAAATEADAPVRDIPMDVPAMQEIAVAAGINHRYDGPWEFFVGGGAAGFDCNGDRKKDLFIAGGTNRAKLYVNKSATAGDIRFAEQPLDLDDALLKGATGAYPLDIDNDGYKDLVILRVGANAILKGGPDCSFTDASREFSFDGGHEWSTAFAATFEAGSIYPTLAFGNYVDRSAPGSPWGTCHDNQLFRPQPGLADGRPDYSSRIDLSPGYCTLSIIFTDWNHSGHADLRMTNDRQYYRENGEEQLWRIEPGRPPRPYRKADGWRHVSIWGMGIAEADLDADGFPEYALTSMGDTKLQTLDTETADGQPVYRDIAYERGATAHRAYTGESLKPSTGWHAEFSDFNNDGNLDLFIAKGNVEQMPEFASFDPDNMLLGNAAGAFVEAGDLAGIALETKGRGAVTGDFNNDGMLDLLVVNRGGPASLFQNTGARTDGNGTSPMGNWIEIELSQDGPNRDAVGARILVKSGNTTRVRMINVGGGHASGSLGFVHAGLGVAERAQIRVQWPDGEWSAPYRVFANQFVHISRGAPAARYWIPEGQ